MIWKPKTLLKIVYNTNLIRKPRTLITRTTLIKARTLIKNTTLIKITQTRRLIRNTRTLIKSTTLTRALTRKLIAFLFLVWIKPKTFTVSYFLHDLPSLIYGPTFISSSLVERSAFMIYLSYSLFFQIRKSH